MNRLKRLTYFFSMLALLLIVFVGLLRLQVIQYIAAYTGFGFAHTTPVTLEKPDGFANADLICQSQPIRVLTFNVRYGSDFIEAMRRPLGASAPGDYQPWSVRYPEIKKLIDNYSPDVIGLQEMHTDKDIAHIVQLNRYTLSTYHLKEFEYGDAALLFKTERFDLLDSGQLWLGPNSTLPLSLGFKPFAMIRYINWVVLREKNSRFSFLFLNTHFDNNPENKEKSADLFYTHFADLIGAYPIILVGDFNTKAVTDRYQRLIGAKDNTPLLINAYDLDVSIDPAETAHPNELIDHILVGGPCKTTANNWLVDKQTLPNGETLSDHFPVFAQVQFTGVKH